MEVIPIDKVVWFFILMVFHALIEAIVTALDGANEVSLEKKMEEGNTKAKLVLWMLDHHRRYITVTDFIRIITRSLYD